MKKENILIRHVNQFKYLASGATTISEIVSELEEVLADSKDLDAKGAILESSVSDGYVFYTIPGHTIKIYADYDDPNDAEELECPICDQ